jgi:4-carboxymuconolactone decarboxylase
MARIEPITTREGLDPAQLQVFDSIAGGARGGVRGPHTVLLHRPEMAAPLDRLGTYVRYDCAIPQRQRELAILVIAAHWRADYEWFAHAPIAETCGIPRPVIDAVGERRVPEFDDPDDALVHGFARELIDTGRVSDETFASAEARFGKLAVLDLVVLLGYYTTIAMVLNAFDVQPPAERDYPWR